MTAPLSLTLSIETPENVVLTHVLAGPGWRALAYLIDYAIRWLILIAGLLILMLTAWVGLWGLGLGWWLLLLFLMEWGYFIGWEYGFQGRTPGKKLCGLRVIHENGQSLSWWGAVLRNLLRAADTLPLLLIYGNSWGPLALMPLYGPALVCMVLNRKMQRLGDLAARTVVIQERKSKLPEEPVIYDHLAPFAAEEINRFVPRSETLALIDEFLSRRSVLTYERGHAMARRLAVALAERLNYRGNWQEVTDYPMAFLARVYVTFAAQKGIVKRQASPPRRKVPLEPLTVA